MTPITLRLRELREARGWSQTELARRAGIQRATVNRLENNPDAGFDSTTLEALANALGVHASGLIVHVQPRSRSR